MFSYSVNFPTEGYPLPGTFRISTGPLPQSTCLPLKVGESFQLQCLHTDFLLHHHRNKTLTVEKNHIIMRKTTVKYGIANRVELVVERN